MAFGLSAGAAALVGAVAAPVIGGMISGNAAKDAADTQAGATRESNAELARAREQARTDLAPWRASGSAANNKLAQLLGLPGYGGDLGAMAGSGAAPVSAPTTYVSGQTDDPVWEKLLGQFNASHQARFGTPMNREWNSDADARRTYADLSQRYADAKAQEAQTTAPAQPMPTDPSYGSLLKPFTGADLASEPGYQFGLAQGQQGIDRRAQAGGSYFSGGALKAAARFGNDYAGTKYGEAFNRDASTKRQAYDFLSGASTAGQNAATMVANNGTQMAGQIGANTNALGNAVGASQIAQGNAMAGGINGAVNGYQQNQLMNAILGGNKGFGGNADAWRTTGNGYGE